MDNTDIDAVHGGVEALEDVKAALDQQHLSNVIQKSETTTDNEHYDETDEDNDVIATAAVESVEPVEPVYDIDFGRIGNFVSNSNSNSKSNNIDRKEFISHVETKKLGIWSKIQHNFKNSSLYALFSRLDVKNPKTLQSAYQLSLQVSLLLLKAFITLKIATLDGQLVSSLISRKFKKFFKYLLFWLLIGIPNSLTDSLLEKSKRLLSQSIRVNLTLNLLDEYLPKNGNSTIYQLLNSQNSSINDPNHRLTNTVENFSKSISILPSQLLTPILDILIAANHMSKSSENSSEGALMLGMVANLSTLVLKVFTPNFSILNNMRNTLENKFHEFHSNIILNNEEIALAKGHMREIDLLDTSYFEFERFERMTLRRLAIYNFAISFIFKYTLGAFGLILCSVPTFTTAYMVNFQNDERVVSKLSSDFVSNRSLLLKASDSLGKLIQSKKNIQNMIGYANELWDFEKELIDINESSELESIINIQKISKDNSNNNIETPLLTGANISYGDEITFNKVPLITPNGTLLVKDLSFSIKQGDNLLIIGPNGCGKSSLFRMLGGLWDIKDPGKLIVPYSKKDLFYLPQRSYFTYGSLREQIIYPDSYDDYRDKILHAKQNGEKLIIDDEYLISLLHKVNLEYLLNYDKDDDDDDHDDYDDYSGNDINDNGSVVNVIENNNDSSSNNETSNSHHGISKETSCSANCIFMIPNLDRIKKWPDLLSVGEQQRLAMVRLYYHCPKFAVLDECTSSISSDLERECYKIATQDLKITVISVCHRTSLWSFHSKILKFKKIEIENKNGNETEGLATTLFTSFDPELRLKRHEEVIAIDNTLKRSDELAKRLNALKKMKNTRSGRRPAMMYFGEDDDDEEEDDDDDDE
ncbi:hypothetical protein C6P42_003384 [Pichia californica]|nr:hypothetical protein C6P42_003384 [[Candida] californica]